MTKSGQLWGGRFTERPDETFAAFNNSFAFDRRLFAADIEASIAHANGLRNAGVLTVDEYDRIKGSLEALLEKAGDPGFFEAGDAEDVHSFIEANLVERLGEVGKKLHTGRSRNDQVATAFRLWLRGENGALLGAVRDVQRALVELAERHKEAVMPGYTHLQRAQPILFAHWCLAYFEMFARDRERLAEMAKRINVMPLGSAALAGTSFPIDREAVAKELGFDRASANSLDAVSDRDFAVEFAGACSLIMVHLSRLAEDLIIYSTAEFGFIELSDAVSTGSSLMPQKKNPDALELIRGKAGRVFGHHIGLLVMLKGLPLAYNKDMQEDKEAVFDCVDTVKMCLNAAAVVMANIKLNEAATRDAATHGFLNATELADYLVKKGVSFRTAHDLVGKIVLYASETDHELHDLELDDLQKFSTEIGPDVFHALDLERTLANKDRTGGTSPERVVEALAAAKRSLADGRNY